jgi:hypothetical protein
MSLLTANNDEKFSSMMKALSGWQNGLPPNDRIYENLCEITAKINTPIDFWTTGAADGDNCIVEQLYSWCSNGTIMKRQEITLPWFDANAPAPNERCLSLKLNDAKFTLDDTECSASKHVACEA